MKKTILIIATFSIIALVGCNKEELREEVKQSNNIEPSFRKYKILKSSGTGWYSWACKDGSAQGGAFSSRAEAKAAGKEHCPGINNVDIINPWEDIMYSSTEEYIAVEIKNIFGNNVTHTNSEISENEFLYWSGEEHESISDARKSIVYLTIMGIYQGGTTINDIKLNHNLSDQNFYLIINREFSENFSLDIDDDSGEYTWTL